MLAAVLNGPEDLQLVEKPKPEPRDGEVLVKVKYCGICGSDLHAYKSGMFPFGMTIGHEYAAEIEAVGDGVEGFAVGQPVTGTASIACRSCNSCITGKDNICEAMNVVGVTREGAMAEYLLIPQETLVPIPDELPLEYGALTEPYSVALHGVDMTDIKPGQTAAIIGAGPIGLCLLAELKRRGIEEVYITDLRAGRLKIALEMGASAVVNSQLENLDKKLNELTTGAGVDYVFECVGVPDTMRDAPGLVRQGGTVVYLGICEIPIELFFLGLVTREIQLRTSYGATAGEFREALKIISSEPSRLKPLVEHVISINNLADEGFTTLLQDDCTAIKILVKVD